MNHLEQYLEAGERFGSVFAMGVPEKSIHYRLVQVLADDRPDDDRVFLEVFGQAQSQVLVEGNPLRINVLKGFGSLLLVNLATGEQGSVFLEPGTDYMIHRGEAFCYENLSDEPLVVRDTCPDFNPNHEQAIDKELLLQLSTSGPQPDTL